MTTTAGSIAFAFMHQCRSLSNHCKSLAAAFSNVGADNIVENFLKHGMKVVRVSNLVGSHVSIIVSSNKHITKLSVLNVEDDNDANSLELLVGKMALGS